MSAARSSSFIVAVLLAGLLAVVGASPAAAAPGRPDTVGVVRDGAFLLRDANSAGPVAFRYDYGYGSDVPLAGDWNGDGRATPGVRRGDTFWLLHDGPGPRHLTIRYGYASDTPVAGDWDGDGVDEVGVRRGGTFWWRNGGAGPRHVTVDYGSASDTPVVGDWDGDGVDEVGVRRGGTFWLRRDGAGPRHVTFAHGHAGDRPVAGSWPDAFTVAPLPAGVRARMSGGSWRTGCPVGLDGLSHLRLRHHGFDGRIRDGELVVADGVAGQVRRAFRDLFDAGFPLQRVRLVDDYGASDDASMAANNTSAFNCRFVGGTTRWSQHAYGTAIDLNPVQNPYVSGSSTGPPAGAAYRDRSHVRPGMIVRPGPVVDAFARIGWGWGGDWVTSKDYQHVSANGR